MTPAEFYTALEDLNRQIHNIPAPDKQRAGLLAELKHVTFWLVALNDLDKLELEAEIEQLTRGE